MGYTMYEIIYWLFSIVFLHYKTGAEYVQLLIHIHVTNIRGKTHRGKGLRCRVLTNEALEASKKAEN